MAGRPPKEGIDYSGWAVDMFESDTKIDKLLDSQGAEGFLVYFYLCQRAYGSKGYYYSWSYDDAATTARKIGGGVGSETVKQTVGLCLQIGLFDKRLFDRDGILTSRGIQKRYWQVARNRTVKPVIDSECWLLTEEESAGLDLCAHKLNFDPVKSNYQPPKLNYETQKESKVKKRIVEKVEPSREAQARTVIEFYESNIGLTPPYVIGEIVSYLEMGMEPDVICEAIKAAVSANALKWAYVDAVLKSCVKDHAMTLSEFKKREGVKTHGTGKQSSAAPSDESIWMRGGVNS